MEPKSGIGKIGAFFGIGSENKDAKIKAKAAKAEPKDTAIAKDQIAKTHKFNIPRLDLTQLSRPEDPVLNAHDADLAVKEHQAVFNKSDILKIDPNKFFTQEDFDELQSREDDPNQTEKKT